jgi:Domain of unknown function (DUF1707)/Cell wall-active antibiotics response 4TMS YvqF
MEEIIAVMRSAGDEPDGVRLRAIIIILLASLTLLASLAACVSSLRLGAASRSAGAPLCDRRGTFRDRGRQQRPLAPCAAMGEPEDYVSDAERERAVGSLRDHLLAGRLTLEEFSERVDLAYSARVGHELARVKRGLPEPGAQMARSSRRKPTRVTTAFLGHVVRRGRLRLRRRTVAAGAFSDLDLDLREAELDSPESSVTVLLAFGNTDIYVPEGVNVTVEGLSVFGHRRDWGRDAARADAPIIRVRAFSVFGTVDVWRVPSGMQGDYGEIFRQLQDPQRQIPM